MKTIVCTFLFAIAAGCSSNSETAATDAGAETGPIPDATTKCPAAAPAIAGTLPGDDEGPCDLVDGTQCTWSSSCPPGLVGGGSTIMKCSAGRWRFVSGGGYCGKPEDSGGPEVPPADTSSPDASDAG